jgi:putative pyoverdin transport system ATP-binding/permease protein
MKLLGFLFRYSPRVLILAASLASVGGFASAWLLMILNAHLKGAAATQAELWEFLGLCGIVLSTLFASRLNIARLTLWSAFDLRLQIGRQWVGLPLQQLEREGNARLLSAITQDVDRLAQSMRDLPRLCVDFTISVACFVYLAYLSWRLLAVLVVFVVVLTLIRGTQKRRYEQLLSDAHRHNLMLLESFNAMGRGIKELKMNRARWNAFYTGELYQTSAQFRDLSYKSEAIFALVYGYSEVAYFLFVAILIFGLPWIGQFSLDLVISFAVTLLFAKNSMDHVLESAPEFARAKVALASLESLGVFRQRSSLSVTKLQRLTARDQVARSAGEDVGLYDGAPKNLKPRLSFKAIEYEYQGSAEEGGFKLGPIDLNIRSGELLFVTGGNGSGKTTFAKILCGLYAPARGELWLDDVQIQTDNRTWYAQQFAAVFSDSHLFSKLYGSQDLPQTSSLVAEYLRELRLENKVKFEQGRFSTLALSQGQRKRLALLVACVENRPFFLFDEWAADQDPEFRRVFYFKILPELKAQGKTIIAITHDDRYYHVADRVLKFEGGALMSDHTERVSERRSHQAGIVADRSLAVSERARDDA